MHICYADFCFATLYTMIKIRNAGKIPLLTVSFFYSVVNRTKDGNARSSGDGVKSNVSNRHDLNRYEKETTHVNTHSTDKSRKVSGTSNDSESDGKALLKITQDLVTNNHLNRECYLLLLDILNEYHNIISNPGRLQEFADDISVNLNVLLCVISNCLGNHFNSFRESIESKVDVFKTENINQIDNLPSAEDLVTLLFPQCMQVFMVTWMSSHNESFTDESDFSPSPKKRKLQDASPSPKNKKNIYRNLDKCESQQTNLFPFIQLILEFANNVLISGVAHVLYSRLLHST